MVGEDKKTHTNRTGTKQMKERKATATAAAAEMRIGCVDGLYSRVYTNTTAVQSSCNALRSVDYLYRAVYIPRYIRTAHVLQETQRERERDGVLQRRLLSGRRYGGGSRACARRAHRCSSRRYCCIYLVYIKQRDGCLLGLVENPFYMLLL